MCVVFICSSEKIDKQLCVKAQEANSDGMGIAWREYDKWRYRKGITEVKELMKLVRVHPLPQIVHFRMASSGGKGKLLTHPFEVSLESPLRKEGEADMLLFHNGHLTIDDRFLDFVIANGIKIPDGEFSDTRCMAIMMAKLGLNLPRFFNSWNKFVVCHGKKYSMYGTWFNVSKGIVASNENWKHSYIGYTGYGDEQLKITTEAKVNTSVAKSDEIIRSKLYCNDLQCGYNTANCCRLNQCIKIQQENIVALCLRGICTNTDCDFNAYNDGEKQHLCTAPPYITECPAILADGNGEKTHCSYVGCEKNKEGNKCTASNLGKECPLYASAYEGY